MVTSLGLKMVWVEFYNWVQADAIWLLVAGGLVPIVTLSWFRFYIGLMPD
jgi:hypothetical protein